MPLKVRLWPRLETHGVGVAQVARKLVDAQRQVTLRRDHDLQLAWPRPPPAGGRPSGR